MRPATKALHAGTDHSVNRPLSTPIYQASTYAWENFEDEPKYVYSRYSNPNREELERTVAALEGAEYGVGYGSGVAAVTACLELAKAGEHVLIAEHIYGGTYNAGKDLLPRHGVEVSHFDAQDPEDVDRKAKDNTTLLVFESPTNPTLRVADIRAVVERAKARGIKTAFDNTFATPLLQNPLSFGVDVVAHSTTKYLGGHSDLVGGVAVTNDAEVYDRLITYATVAGAVPGPFDCWLVCRGIKSLGARMKVHCENAREVATFLRQHPRVARVNYPGFEDHPDHELAKRQMKDFGAMLSFEVGGTEADAMRFGGKLRLFTAGASLGGAESLMNYPRKLSHAGMTEDERIARGITPTLLRLSVGLEDVEDLKEDLDQGLRGL